MRKKICFIVANPMTAKVFLMKHFEYLSKDFDIYLVANFGDKIDLQSTFLKGVKNLQINRSISLLKDISALRELQSYLQNMNFDAVHSITPKAGLLGMMAAKMAGIKIRIHIFTGQVWHTKTGVMKEILKAADRVIVFCATHILVDGKSQREFLIDQNIIHENNSLVLGKGSISGVDTGKFTPDENIRNEVRQKLNYTDEVVFGYLGRLNRDKGILDLANAFALIHAKHPNTKLLLVGFDEEDMMPQVLEICKDFKNAVHYYGQTSEPHKVLQSADVVCLPSYREGFGTSVIEASLLEKPIICSDTYGLRETILENETGLRHEVANVESLREKMEIMLDPQLRTKMGKNGRKYVLDHFGADTISLEWERFYKKISSNT